MTINLNAFAPVNASTVSNISEGVGQVILFSRHGSADTIDLGNVYDVTNTRTATKNDLKLPPRTVGGAGQTVASLTTERTIEDAFKTYTLDDATIALHQGDGVELEAGTTVFRSSDTGESRGAIMIITSYGPGLPVKITARPNVNLASDGTENGPPASIGFKVTELSDYTWTPPASIAALPGYATVPGGVVVIVEDAADAQAIALELWNSLKAVNPGA